MGQIDRNRRRRGCAESPRHKLCTASLDIRPLIDGFAHILEAWTRLKVGIHLCDMPGGHFDPDNPMSEMMIGILIVFANYERRLISQRTKEGLLARKLRGEKYNRWAEYGWGWEKRFDSRLNKQVNLKVPDDNERSILRKVVELRAAGHSFDKIRQHPKLRHESEDANGRRLDQRSNRDFVRAGAAPDGGDFATDRSAELDLDQGRS
jgi:hypothetical protein